MKKILILVDKIGPKKELFAEEISKRLREDTQIFMARFADLYFEIDGKNLLVEIEDFPITDFDLVYFRRTGNKFSGIASTLAVCLKELKIKFIDSAWSEVGPIGSKITSLIKLAREGLPIFPTIYIWQTNIEKFQDRIIERFGFPLVAKELSIQRGMGVFMIKSKDDLEKLPMKDSRDVDNQFLFQKFSDLKDEYRILVLGDRAAVWEKKNITVPGEFRHNIALGAEEEFLPISKIPKEIAETAVKGARALNLEIAGVDVATEKKTGRVLLIEVNRGPGITYDTKISPEIAEIAKFLGKKIH
jgi:glutathione synthase/RimK-type ligase-like ATP-grasp enzyme